MSDFESKVRIDIDAGQALATIKALQRQISDFHTSLAKGSATANLKSLQMQQSLIDTINATGQYSAQMKTVASSTQAFTTALEKNKFSLGQYFRYAGGASKSFGRFFQTEMDTIQKVAIERVKDLQTQYIKMGRDANGALRSIAVRPLALDMENLSTKTQIAAQKQQLLNQLLKQGSTNLLNFGKNTQWAGRQLMVGFTIPLGILGTTAAKTFMQMEEQAIKFKRVYGDTFTASSETDAMIKQVQQLASEFTKYGVAVEKTMEQAATAAATGKMGAELLAQVSESTRLSVLGNVEQQKALETTISLTNAFGTSADQLRGKINFLNAVENQTITSIEDLTTAIPKAAPVIKQMGGNVEDLAFFLTAMREGGINASEGANALKSGLAALINPTTKASKMLQGFGINITSIVEKNKGDVKNLVIDFAKALDTLDPLNRARAIEQLFGKFQFSRLSTLFQNVIKDGSQAARVLELTKQSSAELGILAQRELNRISSSPMYKFQKAVADFKKELAPVGEEFLKAVTPLIKFGTDVLKAFNSLDGGVKQFIINTGGLVAGLGPIFLMTFGLIANGVANLIKGFSFVKSVFNKTTTASTVLGETTNYMTQQQIEAAAVAASLEQVHNKLIQSFTVETQAVSNLTTAYQKAVSAQIAFSGTGTVGRTGKVAPKKYADGIFSVPGPKGAGDIIPAMLAPGEAVIPAKPAEKYRGFIKSMIAGNIPGFETGTSDARQKVRAAPKTIIDQVRQLFSAGWTGQDKERTSMRKVVLKEADARGLVGRERENFLSKYGFGKSGPVDSTHMASGGDDKYFTSKNVLPEHRALNQVFADAVEKRGSFIEKTLKDKTLIAKMVAESGLDEKTLRREIGRLNPLRPGGAIYPTTQAGQRALLSVYQNTDKPTAGTRIAAAGLSTRLSLPSQAGGFFEGAKPGGKLRLNPALDAKAISEQERKIVNSKKIESQSVKAKKANVAAVNKNTKAVNAETAEAKKSTKARAKSNKAIAKATPVPTISQREQLGAGVTKVIGTDKNGKEYVKFFVNGKPTSKATAEKLVSTYASGQETSKRSTASRFLSRGRLGALGLGASLAGGAMGGDTGNLLQDAGNIALILDALRFLVPKGAQAKAATMLEPLLSALKGLAPRLFKLGGVITAATLGFDALNYQNSKQEEAAKEITNALNNTKDRFDTINEFFGTTGAPAGIRSYLLGTGEASKANAALSEQFRTSDQFKTAYGETAKQLSNSSNALVKLTLESLATELLQSGIGEEQAQIIIDAIRKESNQLDVKIDVKSLTLSSKTGQVTVEKNIAKSISEFGKLSNDPFSFLKGEQKGAMISTAASNINALAAAYQNGAINGVQFGNAMISVNQQIAKLGDKATQLSMLKGILEKLNPELAAAASGISDVGDYGSVMRAAASGISMDPATIGLLGTGSDKQKSAIRTAMGKAYIAQGKQLAKVSKLQEKLAGTNTQQQNLQTTEDNINKLYDNRITALERINDLQNQITDRQKSQLDLADALSQGDIFAAAKAAQDIRAKDAEYAFTLQKQGLEDARNKAVEKISNQQATIANASQSIQNQIVKEQSVSLSLESFLPKGFDFKVESINEVPVGFITGGGGTYLPIYALPGYSPSNTGTGTTKGGTSTGKGGSGNSGLPSYGWSGSNQRTRVGTNANGGYITGPGSGTSDSIPAMLSNGEYVIRANAVKAIGTDALDELNYADKFANGGLVQKFSEGGQPDPEPYHEPRRVSRDRRLRQAAIAKQTMQSFDLAAQKLLNLAQSPKYANSSDIMRNSVRYRLINGALALKAYGEILARNERYSFVSPKTSGLKSSAMLDVDRMTVPQLLQLAKSITNTSAPTTAQFTQIATKNQNYRVAHYNPIIDWMYRTGIYTPKSMRLASNSVANETTSQSLRPMGPHPHIITGAKNKFNSSYVGAYNFSQQYPEGNVFDKRSQPLWKNFKSDRYLMSLMAKFPFLQKRLTSFIENRRNRISLSSRIANRISGRINPNNYFNQFARYGMYPDNVRSRLMNIRENFKNQYGYLGYLSTYMQHPGRKDGLWVHEGQHITDKWKSSLLGTTGYKDYALNKIGVGVVQPNNAISEATARAAEKMAFPNKDIKPYNHPFVRSGSNIAISKSSPVDTLAQALVNLTDSGFSRQYIATQINDASGRRVSKQFGPRYYQISPQWFSNYASTAKEQSKAIGLSLHSRREYLAHIQIAKGLKEANLDGRSSPTDFISFLKVQSAKAATAGEKYKAMKYAMAAERLEREHILQQKPQSKTARTIAKVSSGIKGISKLFKDKAYSIRYNGQIRPPEASPLRSQPSIKSSGGSSSSTLPAYGWSGSTQQTRVGKANGGLVNIPKFKNGGMFRIGYSGGGLALLHDKEFVMNPGAVKEYGVDKLKAMNNGTYNSGSVYNSYGVNVNVGGSNANANDIARTVIREIKKINSQNIRSTTV